MKIKIRVLLLILFVLASLTPVLLANVAARIVMTKELNENTRMTLLELAELVKANIVNNFGLITESAIDDFTLAEREFYRMAESDKLSVSPASMSLAIENRETGEREQVLVRPIQMPDGTMLDGSGDVLKFIEQETLIESMTYLIIPQGLLQVSSMHEGRNTTKRYYPIASEVYQKINRGERVVTREHLNDEWHTIVINPIRDESNNIIGAFGSTLQEKEFTDVIINGLADFKVGFSGNIIAIQDDGLVALWGVTRSLEGENVMHYESTDGKLFVRDIIQLSIDASQEANPVDQFIYYDYKWASDELRKEWERMGVYSYIPEAKWIVGVQAYSREFYGPIVALQKFLYLLAGVLTLVCFMVALFVSYRIAYPMKVFGNNIDKLAQGDLSEKIKMKTAIGEFATFTKLINDHLIVNLNATISGVRSQINDAFSISNTFVSVADSSIERGRGAISALEDMVKQMGNLLEQIEGMSNSILSIDRLIQSQEEIIENQSAAVTETSAAIEQISSSIDTMANISRQKQEATGSLIQITTTGNDKVKEMEALITEIAQGVDNMVEMISIINEIAAQTNLLSMNAAIEAAHAGDLGKGFAVVADEIRSLAESTSNNANSISNFLKETVQKIKTLNDSSSQAGKVFEQVIGEVTLFVNAFKEISNNTAELRVGASEIVTGMKSLEHISLQIKEGANSLTESSKEIKGTVSTVEDFSKKNSARLENVKDEFSTLVSDQDKIRELSQASLKGMEELQQQISIFKIEGENKES